MVYKVALRTFDGKTLEKKVTKDANEALEIFSEIVNRTSLDGLKVLAKLSLQNREVACHRFDRHAGDREYMRDKLEEIECPQVSGGRPAQLRDGRRINVYLDAESLVSATEIGQGNVSEGIRRALKEHGVKEKK